MSSLSKINCVFVICGFMCLHVMTLSDNVVFLSLFEHRFSARTAQDSLIRLMLNIDLLQVSVDHLDMILNCQHRVMHL